MSNTRGSALAALLVTLGGGYAHAGDSSQPDTKTWTVTRMHGEEPTRVQKFRIEMTPGNPDDLSSAGTLKAEGACSTIAASLRKIRTPDDSPPGSTAVQVTGGEKQTKGCTVEENGVRRSYTEAHDADSAFLLTLRAAKVVIKPDGTLTAKKGGEIVFEAKPVTPPASKAAVPGPGR
ncbi:MAG: hypothetical protein M3O22_02610 [Pseudomonadota bacterium]|nr:hypothetical protein [Pseudomonadota bacterium]